MPYRNRLKPTFSKIRYILRDRRATVAFMVALALPVLIGTSGFSVDVGLWYGQQSALQSATDAAAIKAARDLALNAATTPATLESDAVAAANGATPEPLNLTSANLTATQLADPRQVQVNAVVPAMRFFSQLVFPFTVNVHASSTAGVAYSIISTQATCYAVDSYTYLYSTGFGTIDTSHSAGIDPYKCGSPPSAPSAYDAYCGGGVLGCSLDVLNAGNLLLPFALQLGTNGGAGGIVPVLAPVTQTLTNLLGATGGLASAIPTVLGPGSPQCPGNVCTISAGVYDGGLIIQPGVSIDFTPNGGNDTFLIENGDLNISTQDSMVGSNPNAVFFFGGAQPGAFIFSDQVQINTAPINNGAILLTSASTFQSGSVIGTQTSAPISAMPYAQQAALSAGLLSILGLPGQNLVGTNFDSVVATCPQATSTCSNPSEQPALFQSTLMPSLGVLATLLPNLTLADLLANEGETSTTTITSGITFANGVPTDWQQQETANSTLTNTLQTVANILSELGVSGVLGGTVTPLLQGVLNAIAPNESASQTAAGSGVFTGQTTNGTPSCAGKTVLYSQTFAPSYGPGFTDVLDTAGENGASGALSTSDTITVCGSSMVATIAPISPGTIMVSSTAAGSSTLSLLK